MSFSRIIFHNTIGILIDEIFPQANDFDYHALGIDQIEPRSGGHRNGSIPHIKSRRKAGITSKFFSLTCGVSLRHLLWSKYINIYIYCQYFPAKFNKMLIIMSILWILHMKKRPLLFSSGRRAKIWKYPFHADKRQHKAIYRHQTIKDVGVLIPALSAKHCPAGQSHEAHPHNEEKPGAHAAGFRQLHPGVVRHR